MPRIARLLFLLTLGALSGPALADEGGSGTPSLPCNALCRRWMGYDDAVRQEPSPVAERQAAPAPVVASPLPPPSPAVTHRPEAPRVARQASPVPLVARPPVKPRRDPRIVEARRPPSPAAPAHALRTAEAPAPRRPTSSADAVVVARVEPGVASIHAAPAVRLPMQEVASAQPIALETRTPAPGPAARPVDFVLPLLEQPPPPVIEPPRPARVDAMPPAFDVIATLLLAAPPRR